MPNEPVLPASLRIAAHPGESINQDFVVPSPPNGALTATMVGDASIFRLREFVAYRMERIRLTDDEFAQLPPHLRNEAHRWAVEHVVVGRVGPGTPLSVSPELHVTGIIDFVAPAGAAPNYYRAKLAIDGLQSNRVEVPLLFVVGELKVEFPAGPVVIHQNQSTPIPVRVTLTGAPETELKLAVTHGYLEAPSVPLHVPSGRSADAVLNMLVLDNAPIGPLATNLTIMGHSQKINFVQFTAEVKPPLPHPPPQRLALNIEGTSSVQNGVTLVNTDNPQVEIVTKLIKVQTEWANGMVPQVLVRQNNGWRFTNGNAQLSVSNGEAEAGPRPVRAGSLSDGADAWPTADGTFSGDAGSEVKLVSRIRVGYRPVDIKLLVQAPKNGFAANVVETARIALDPQVLLVPVEVARFFSDQIPVSNISAANQMALWDQVPIISPTTNFRSTDGSTGELKFVEKAWDFWPTPDAEGLYTQGGWVSPDSIWRKAGVRFRLVNYIDIKTGNEHVAPVAGQGTDDRRLRENHDALTDHPQHIKDKRVLKVIFMHRIAPPDAPEIGRALIGSNCIGIAAGASDRFATIAHEIGHLITGSQAHSTLPNNVMNDPGPGTQVTEDQIAKARAWAQNFTDFWQR